MGFSPSLTVAITVAVFLTVADASVSSRSLVKVSPLSISQRQRPLHVRRQAITEYSWQPKPLLHTDRWYRTDEKRREGWIVETMASAMEMKPDGVPSIKPRETPLPKKQMIAVYAAQVCEALQITFLYPFLVNMVEDFRVAKTTIEVSKYVGALGASFSAAQLFSSFLWGRLSDKIGRKKSIIIGISGTILSLVMFGTASTFQGALLARIFCGLTNGNIGVLKSFVTEITDGTNRVKAFAYISIAWGIGAILGPLIGGYLSNPVTAFPTLFGGFGLFRQSPYLLPCIVTIGFQSVSLAVVSMLMKDPGSNDSQHPMRVDDAKILAAASAVSKKTTKNPLTSWGPLSACLTYGILSLIQSLDNLLILFLLQRPLSSGGVGLDPGKSGLILSSSMLFVFVANYMLPLLTKRSGQFPVFFSSLVIFAGLVALTPAIGSLAGLINSAAVLTFIMFLLVGLRQLVLGILMSLAIIFVNNAAAPGSVGAVNGLGQTMAAFLRALGPFLAGNIWASTRFTEMSPASVGAGGAAKAAVGGSGSLMMFISNQLAFAVPTMLIGGLFALVRSMPPSLQYPYTNELESTSSAAPNVGSNATTAQEELFDETFLDDSLTRLGATLDDEDSSSQNNATSAGGLNSAVVPSLNATRLTGDNDLYF